VASTAMVQVLADTSRFDENLRSELTRIINRIEAELPPITIHVRLDDDDARNQLRRLTNTRPDPIRVRVDADTDRPLQNISNLIAKISLVGPAVVQAGVAAVGALAGLGAAFVTAGAAVGAFTAAAKPQLAEVTEVTELYEDAQKAAADGAKDAAKKQEEYRKALEDLQPATRDTAKSFIGLKEDFKAWSDSLASTTMPIFTKGIELLRSLLPELTPLVKVAAKQFENLIDHMQDGVDNGGFAKFIDAVVETATTTLPMLMRSFGNIIRGIIGIGKAFAPVTEGVGQGFEDMTEKFEAWGTSLSTNTKFQEFLSTFQTGSGELQGTLRNLGQIFVNLLVALGPFVGIMLQLVEAFTAFLAILPPPVVTALAVAFTAWAVAIKLITITMYLIEAATLIWAAAQWVLNASLLGFPLIWIIGAVLAIIAIIVLIATKTEWFKDIWNAVWTFVKNLVITVWNAVSNFLVTIWTNTANFFKSIWTSVSNFFINLWNGLKSFVVNVWTGIKNFFVTIWNAIKTVFSVTLGAIKTVIVGAWNGIKAVTSIIWNAIKNTILGIFKAIWSGIKSAVMGIVNTVKSIKNTVVNFFKGAASWLINSGKALIRGFVNGIKSMASSVYNSIKGIVSKARNLLPFSPAKEGPFSGRGYTTYSGKALMEGFLQGIEGAAPTVQAGMSKVLESLPSFAPTTGLPAFERTTQTEGLRIAKGDFAKRHLNFRGDQSANVTVMIGNRVVDQYVESKIAQNNQARDRMTYQGMRR